MIISAKPYPNISNLSSQIDQHNIENISFFLLGRDALISAILNLGLKKGDKIIIPAYMCESAIKPLEIYGFKLVYVDVEMDLTFSLDKLKKIIKNNPIKALLAVHYFGFTKEFDNVIDLCQKSGVKVVEDASHSFMSQLLRNHDDIKCDAEIFSMRKTLPVFDGGALRMKYNNYEEANKLDNTYSSKMNDIKYLISRLLEKILTGMGVNIYSQFLSKIRNQLPSNNNSNSIVRKPKPIRPSWLLNSYLSNDKYLESIDQIINRNFKQLSQGLLQLGFRLLFDSVKKGIVPQACIVKDHYGGLVEYLRSNGIGSCRWPDKELPREVINNPDLFSNTILLNNNLVLIPIHQSLNSKKINNIIQVLRVWKVKKFKNK